MSRKRPAILDKQWWSRYGASLRFAFYCLLHPFDGYWDLTHEKRGSMAAANTIMFFVLLTRILTLEFTNFQFMSVNWEYVNVFQECLSLLLPLIVFVTANWCWTTLFDGKGTFKDIYVGMCYSILPYPLIQLPLILLSNVITTEEGAFYYVFAALSLIWAVYLIVIAMMEIHDYSVGKTFLFTIMSLFGMLIIIFLLLLFLSLISDAISYFVSLYREIVFRLF
ncbi:MAG: YIP1 family protein [Eubacteriales bacterium]|nr:YIP1 family protein [Eubacteriales bacterium]MDD3882676.1 YIP1 family protein [Eubacteriales bacterium]MDD4512752.1 YIP1 family protein [Eubacteriales bacterium]